MQFPSRSFFRLTIGFFALTLILTNCSQDKPIQPIISQVPAEFADFDPLATASGDEAPGTPQVLDKSGNAFLGWGYLDREGLHEIKQVALPTALVKRFAEEAPKFKPEGNCVVAIRPLRKKGDRKEPTKTKVEFASEPCIKGATVHKDKIAFELATKKAFQQPVKGKGTLYTLYFGPKQDVPVGELLITIRAHAQKREPFRADTKSIPVILTFDATLTKLGGTDYKGVQVEFDEGKFKNLVVDPKAIDELKKMEEDKSKAAIDAAKMEFMAAQDQQDKLQKALANAESQYKAAQKNEADKDAAVGTAKTQQKKAEAALQNATTTLAASEKKLLDEKDANKKKEIQKQVDQDKASLTGAQKALETAKKTAIPLLEKQASEATASTVLAKKLQEKTKTELEQAQQRVKKAQEALKKAEELAKPPMGMSAEDFNLAIDRQ